MIAAWLDRCEKVAAEILASAGKSSDHPDYLRLLPTDRPSIGVKDAAAILFRVRCIRQAQSESAVDNAIYNTALLVEHMRNLGVRELLPDAQLGKERRQAQSARGKDGAEKRWAWRQPISEFIKRLATRKDELGDPMESLDLWPILYDELDRLGLNPKEVANEKGRPIAYEFHGGRQTYKAFREAIRRAR